MKFPVNLNARPLKFYSRMVIGSEANLEKPKKSLSSQRRNVTPIKNPKQGLCVITVKPKTHSVIKT